MTIDENEMNRRLIKLAQSPSSRFWRIDYGALSPPERVFRVVWELEAEVNNGGFRQYFLNTSGSLVPDTADALRAIGAATMSEIVEQAVEAVGHDISWSNDGARKAVLSALAPGTVAKLGEFDQAFFTYPDNLTALLYKYVSDHREEINVPSEF
jgi:Domain of unknown function (DUF4375)